MDAVNLNLIVIFVGVIALALGLALHFWSVSAAGRPYFNTTTIVAWLLIALFPVLVLFSFFPGSNIEGEILGVSAGGAVALFLVIWYYGPKQSKAGRARDVLEQRITELETENDDLANQMRESQGVRAKPLRHSVLRYGIKGLANKELDIITGNLIDVRECDCWVNSENNYMQMSRVFERSISAVIRYHGSRRDGAGNVIEDLIADELRDSLQGAKFVQPASVYLTSAGELENSHRVKLIAHVASVTGQVGIGWIPIDRIHSCVSAVLRTLDRDDRANEVRSVLFPLMGTGQAAGSRERDELVQALFGEAIDYLSNNRDTKLERVCFLAWTDIDFQSCERVIRTLPNILPRQ